MMKKILYTMLLLILMVIVIFLLKQNRMKQKNDIIYEEGNEISNSSITNEIENNIDPSTSTKEQNNNTASASKKENNNIAATSTQKKNSNTTSAKKQNNSTTSTKKQNSNTASTNSSEKKETAKEATFTSSKIPDSILKKMIGNSIPEKSKDKVDTNNLSYLKITYWGFDSKTHVGEMIVNKKVAQEVLAIFKEVYNKKYPIEKMKLIDYYGANDEKSMRDNNTSAFCYRVVANTNTLSNHSKGTAIDINPLYNPYIVGSYISPSTASKYTNRNLTVKGMIKKGDALYTAFTKRGWTWGGSWKSKKDYQHFEKSI